MHYYKDRPDKIQDWLTTLSDEEHATFDVGYLLALEAILEDLVDSKRKILSKIMENPDSKRSQLLNSRIYILDLYEKNIQQRITTLAIQSVKQLSC